MHLHITFAYIDPGSGTYVLQFLLAGAAAFVWRVASIFTGRKKATPAIVQSPEDADAQSAAPDRPTN